MLNKFQLSEPYCRVLSSALSIIEEMLFELDDLLECQRIGSIFTDVVNTLDSEHRQLIYEEVESMRHKLRNIKTTLDLKSTTVNNTALISSRCGKIWEILCDLETKRLRRYGEPPDGLSDYLDCRIRELISSIERVTKLSGEKDDRIQVCCEEKKKN